MKHGSITSKGKEEGKLLTELARYTRSIFTPKRNQYTKTIKMLLT